MRIADFPPLLIDAQRYDVEMLSRDIPMFEDNVGLVAVTHTLHVFLCDFPELFVVQPGDELRLRRVAFDDYELLAEESFDDKPAAVMLKSGFAEQLVEADVLRLVKPEGVFITRSSKLLCVFSVGIHNIG